MSGSYDVRTGEECGRCIWIWCGGQWILMQNHCRKGCKCARPTLEDPRPCQIVKTSCHRHVADVDYGYTVCQFDGQIWNVIQANCKNGGEQNCGGFLGGSRDDGPQEGDIDTFPCAPPERHVQRGAESASAGRSPCGEKQGDASEGLAQLIQSWSNLSPAVRAGILALIKERQ